MTMASTTRAGATRPIARLALLLVLALASAAAHAQSFPSKPIRILVPFVAGGSSDIVARSIGAKFQELLGQPAVVENRTGANGGIAAAALAKAPADGYTILVGSIGVFAINVALYKDLPYDPVRDFEPLSLAVTTPNVLIVKTSLPVNTVKELVEYARKHVGKVSYSSSGTGSSDHLSAELFKQMTKTFGVHIPYRGGAAAMADMIGGNVDASFQNLGAASTHVKGGKLRALAVTSKARSPLLPDVPTMIESGLPGFEVTSWQAVATTKGTPREAVATLQSAVAKALRSPDVEERLTKIGFDVVASTPEQFGAFMKAEIERWRKVVTTSGIQPD
jgi:tripartite-type tricarboxylate transporter receptor subunit TctC